MPPGAVEFALYVQIPQTDTRDSPVPAGCSANTRERQDTPHRPRYPMKKALLITSSILFTLVIVGLPATVGIRPFIGPRARVLTDRRFDASPARLERGKYLVTTARTP